MPRKTLARPRARPVCDESFTDAITDPDTGLPVLKHFKDEVEAAPVKLAVDVQGLKWINDNFGFSSGNALLRTLADTARDQGYDIYRVGGDEFVLTFNTQEEALVAISKLKEEFRAAYVPVRTETGDVIYYRGFVIYSGTGDTFDSAYRELDWDKKNLKAMYEAVNPELVRGGRPPGIKEAARLYNMANPEERRRALIDLFRFNEKQADAEMMILQRAAVMHQTGAK